MQYYSKQPNQIIKYSGTDLPSIINDILKIKGAFFGGSSLMHDIYFEEEDWGERDYDIWCSNNAFIQIHQFLTKSVNLLKISKNVVNTGYYENFRIRRLREYIFSTSKGNIKIQLINVARRKFIDYVVEKIDFSFSTLIYDGENLLFFKTDEVSIKSKRGTVSGIVEKNSCPCADCKRRKLNSKNWNRIRKYINRGFTIENICMLCYPHNIHIISLKDCMNCIYNEKNFFVNKEDSRAFLEEKLVKCDGKHSTIILAFLVVCIRMRDLEFFLDYYKRKEEFIDIYSEDYFYALYFLAQNGAYTAFKTLMDKVIGKVDFDSKLKEFFNTAVKNNYKNIALYYCRVNPRYSVEIYEDVIVSDNVSTLFKYYLDTSDISIFAIDLPDFTVIEDGMEECPVCKFNNVNLQTKCGHNFCGDCILGWMENNKNCPICRSEIYN